MTETIYIALLDEGLDVWRPANAWRTAGKCYIVLRPDEYDPDLERWQFPPGSVVECETRQSGGASILAATRLISLTKKTA